MIRFKVDENLPQAAAELLRSHGHDALTVVEQNLSGATDESVASVCTRESRILVTLDLDFADARRLTTTSPAGLVVLRLARQDKSTILQTLAQIMPTMAQTTPAGKLWIVEETQIRIRE